MIKLTKAQFNAVRKKLKNEGKLTASGLLQEAKKKTSPLHGMFEWDDTKAANEYRRQQARIIIKRYNVSIEEPGERVVHVPSVKRGEGSYKESLVVVQDVSEFELAMSEALSKLRASELSVAHLNEIARIESPDTIGILAIAMKGLNAATTALNKIH